MSEGGRNSSVGNGWRAVSGTDRLSIIGWLVLGLRVRKVTALRTYRNGSGSLNVWSDRSMMAGSSLSSLADEHDKRFTTGCQGREACNRKLAIRFLGQLRLFDHDVRFFSGRAMLAVPTSLSNNAPIKTVPNFNVVQW